VTEHLNSSLDIKEVFSLMTTEIAQAFDLKGVTIRLRDQDSKELKLVASHGLSEKYLNKGPVSSERIQTVVKDKMEFVDDVASYDIDYKEERQEEGIAAMLHLPITIKGTVIGIMGLYSDTKRVVADDDIALISSIARQCGLAIQNASLFLEVKKDKKDLENEIWAHRAWF
jgi:GAF domain-containing protein